MRSASSLSPATRHAAPPAGGGVSLLLAGAAVAAAALMAGPAAATTLAALVGGRTLVFIDAEAKEVTSRVTIKGEALVGIDVRPADGILYGVTRKGTIVAIAGDTGATLPVAKISEPLPKGVVSVDFNPVADRLRVIGSDGRSLRVNLADGKATVDGNLLYAASDANAGKSPKVGAVAYTNSAKGAKETTLIDIDAGNGLLVKQAPPNDGTLNTVAEYSSKFRGPLAFDISPDVNGGNVGWLVYERNVYTLDLKDGSTNLIGAVRGLAADPMDIAVLP